MGVLLEDDFAEELEAALLELDRGVTQEDDFGAELLLDLAELLLEFALLELGGTTLEEDFGSLEELELYLPKYTIMVVSLST